MAIGKADVKKALDAANATLEPECKLSVLDSPTGEGFTLAQVEGDVSRRIAGPFKDQWAVIHTLEGVALGARLRGGADEEEPRTAAGSLD